MNINYPPNVGTTRACRKLCEVHENHANQTPRGYYISGVNSSELYRTLHAVQYKLIPPPQKKILEEHENHVKGSRNFFLFLSHKL